MMDSVGKNRKVCAYNGKGEVAEEERFRIKCYLTLKAPGEHYCLVSIGPCAGITALNKKFRVLLF